MGRSEKWAGARDNAHLNRGLSTTVCYSTHQQPPKSATGHTFHDQCSSGRQHPALEGFTTLVMSLNIGFNKGESCFCGGDNVTAGLTVRVDDVRFRT